MALPGNYADFPTGSLEGVGIFSATGFPASGLAETYEITLSAGNVTLTAKYGPLNSP